MCHVFNASLNGRINSLEDISYMNNPKLNIYFIAAKETMNDGLLPKILSYAGSIPIERTWRSKGQNLKRPVNKDNIKSIDLALEDGWVITFPQGTTTAFKPVRKGTAHMILKNKPIVIPIVIDGFRRSFDKKGLVLKKRGSIQRMNIKPPMKIDYENDSVEKLVEEIGLAIEQHLTNQ